MKKAKVLKLLLAAIWVAQLTSLSSCQAVPDLPEPVQQSYNTNKIFTLTWFEKPFMGYSMYMILHTNGYISRMLISGRGEKGGFPEQLTAKQRKEIWALLDTLTHSSSRDPSGGSRVITLSFLWQGKHHILSFNESSCPDELQRLFEITNETRESEYRNPFPSPCNGKHPQQASEPTPSDSSVELPDFVRRVHYACLFHITWFKQPFADSYKELSLLVDHYMGENTVTYWETGQNTAYGELTEAERQEIQAILATLTDTSSTRLPAEGTVITLGFSWEGDYRILVFGDANCPAGLRRLFEIADMPFKRDVPDYDLFQIPCAPISTVTSTLQTP